MSKKQQLTKNTSNDEDDFQIFVSKEDLSKYQNFQAMYKKQKQQCQKITKQLNYTKELLKTQKKCTYIKTEQVNYLIGQINLYCDSMLGSSQIQRIGSLSTDIGKSFYQDLVDKNLEMGICGIMGQQVYQSFKDSHEKVFKRLNDVQKKVMWYTQEVARRDKLQEEQKYNAKNALKLTSIIDQVKNTQRFSKVDQDIMNDLLKQKTVMQNKLKLLQKDFDDLIEQNLQMQKQIRDLKSQKKKSQQQSSPKLNSQKKQESDKNQISAQQKVYQIKLMIDQYYRDLQKNLGLLGGLSRQQVQLVVENEFKGIKDYVDNLIKKTFVSNNNNGKKNNIFGKK